MEKVHFHHTKTQSLPHEFVPLPNVLESQQDSPSIYYQDLCVVMTGSNPLMQP